MELKKSVILDKNSAIPLYHQIKEDIIMKINNNEYQLNEKLPAENELISSYGVSRTTVRKAVELLVNEGYLKVKRGVGTFIEKPTLNLWNLEKLRGFDEEVNRQGLHGKTEVLNIQKINSNKKLKSIFGNSYKEYYKLDRLRYIEDEPSILVTTYLPKDIAPDLDKFDFAALSLFNVLKENYHIKIDYATRTFEAINASEEIAKMLHIEKNSAIQLVDTVTYDDKNTPIEYSISRDRGDITRFKVILKM